MNVSDVMTTAVASCAPETNLAAAAMMMWDADCGMLPVIHEDGRVIGVVTDRDITMAVATKSSPASQILVREVLSGRLFGCSGADDLRAALAIMETEKIRRLPVLNADGRLQGMLSINDVILHAEPGSDLAAHLIRTLKSICGRHALVGA